MGAIIAASWLVGGCSSVPGETLSSGGVQREVRDRVLAAAKSKRPDCRQQKIADTEIVDLHPDGKAAVELWIVEQCGQRVRYFVTFPPKGRGTAIQLQEQK
jgi:hypothetical protein